MNTINNLLKEYNDKLINEYKDYNEIIDNLYKFFSPYDIKRNNNYNTIDTLFYDSQSLSNYFAFIQTQINIIIKLYNDKKINKLSFLLYLIQYKLVIKLFWNLHSYLTIKKKELMFICIKIIMLLNNPINSLKYIILIYNLNEILNNNIKQKKEQDDIIFKIEILIDIFREFNEEQNKIIEYIINYHTLNKYNIENFAQYNINISHIQVYYKTSDNIYNHSIPLLYNLILFNYKKEIFYLSPTETINLKDFNLFNDLNIELLIDIYNTELTNDIVKLYDILNIDINIVNECFKSNNEIKYYNEMIDEIQKIIISLSLTDNIKEYFNSNLYDLIKNNKYQKYIPYLYSPINEIILYLNNIYDNLIIYVDRELKENNVSVLLKNIILYLQSNMLNLLNSLIEPIYFLNLTYILLLSIQILQIPMFLLYLNKNVVKYHTFIIKNIFDYIKINIQNPSKEIIDNIIEFRDNYFKLTKELLNNNFNPSKCKNINEKKILEDLNLDNIKKLLMNYNYNINNIFSKKINKKTKIMFNRTEYCYKTDINVDELNVFLIRLFENNKIINLSLNKDIIIKIINNTVYPDFIGNYNNKCKFLMYIKKEVLPLYEEIKYKDTLLFTYNMLIYNNIDVIKYLNEHFDEITKNDILNYIINNTDLINNINHLSFKDLYIHFLINSKLHKLKEYYILEHLILNSYDEDFKCWYDKNSYNSYIINLLSLPSHQSQLSKKELISGGNNNYYYKYLKYKLKYNNLKFN